MALVFLNYRLNPHELAWIIDKLEGQDPARRTRLPRRRCSTSRPVPTVEHVVVIGGHDRPGRIVAYDDPARRRRPAAELPAERDDVAWQLYTSGTTGARRERCSPTAA